MLTLRRHTERGDAGAGVERRSRSRRGDEAAEATVAIRGVEGDAQKLSYETRRMSYGNISKN